MGGGLRAGRALQQLPALPRGERHRPARPRHPPPGHAHRGGLARGLPPPRLQQGTDHILYLTVLVTKLTKDGNFHNIAQITFPDCRGVSYEEMVPEAPASAVSLLSQLVSRRGYLAPGTDISRSPVGSSNLTKNNMTAGDLRQRGEAGGCRGRAPRLLHGAAPPRPAGGDDPAPGEEGGAGRGRGRRQGRYTLPQTLREAAQCG